MSSGLSSTSHLTPSLSLQLTGGSSPTASAQSILTLPRSRGAQGFCWETSLMPAHPHGVSQPELQHKLWLGSHSPHRGQDKQTRILFATPALLLQPVCLHQFLSLLSFSVILERKLLQGVGHERCNVRMESLCTSSRTRLNIWLHNRHRQPHVQSQPASYVTGENGMPATCLVARANIGD